jgi:hypothetical protein
MKGHASSTMCAICVTAFVAIGNGAALAPRGQDPEHSGATCAMRASLGVFVHPTTFVKYDSKTNPSVWLEDYRLTCRAGGVDDDLFIIQFLPIYLADTSRAWLDHLSRNSIGCWEDLKEIFIDNFHGTYVRPDNPWDLKGCRQKQGNPYGITSGASSKSVTNSTRSVTSMSSLSSGLA